jgi:hypothetical protein
METREAVIKALDEGKKLTSSSSGIQYKLIEGKLHSRSSERSGWEPSELSFFNPPSWLNLRD